MKASAGLLSTTFPSVSDPLHLFISVSSETGVIGGCDPPLWVLGIKLGPLEEQPVLLTTEQPFSVLLYRNVTKKAGLQGRLFEFRER